MSVLGPDVLRQQYKNYKVVADLANRLEAVSEDWKAFSKEKKVGAADLKTINAFFKRVEAACLGLAEETDRLEKDMFAIEQSLKRRKRALTQAEERQIQAVYVIERRLDVMLDNILGLELLSDTLYRRTSDPLKTVISEYQESLEKMLEAFNPIHGKRRPGSPEQRAIREKLLGEYVEEQERAEHLTVPSDGGMSSSSSFSSLSSLSRSDVSTTDDSLSLTGSISSESESPKSASSQSEGRPTPFTPRRVEEGAKTLRELAQAREGIENISNPVQNAVKSLKKKYEKELSRRSWSGFNETFINTEVIPRIQKLNISPAKKKGAIAYIRAYVIGTYAKQPRFGTEPPETLALVFLAATDPNALPASVSSASQTDKDEIINSRLTSLVDFLGYASREYAGSDAASSRWRSGSKGSTSTCVEGCIKMMVQSLDKVHPLVDLVIVTPEYEKEILSTLTDEFLKGMDTVAQSSFYSKIDKYLDAAMKISGPQTQSNCTQSGQKADKEIIDFLSHVRKGVEHQKNRSPAYADKLKGRDEEAIFTALYLALEKTEPAKRPASRSR